MSYTARNTAPIILNAFTMATVSHLNYGLWRHPRDRTHRYTSVEYWVELAQSLDRAGFDCLFIADALGLIDVYGGSPEASLRHGIQSPLIDPLLLVSAMAAATRHLGFGITLSTTYEHPYLAARKFSTLDHLTKGRIGWNVVTSQQDSAARNLGLGRQVPHDKRYDVADEFLQVTYKLWQASWEDDAVVRNTDLAGSVYTQPEKVHSIRHEGRYFTVPDGHVVQPSPQRVPVVLQAGTSARGSEFAARHAEVVFVVGAGASGVRENVRGIRAQAARFGRNPDNIKFITAVAVVVAETDEDAAKKFEDYYGYYDPVGSIIHYSSMTGVDFASTERDDVVRYQPTEASQSVLRQFDPAVSGRQWTLEQAANPERNFGRARTFIGSAQTVADALERWLDETETDGINLIQLVNPESFEDFGRLVIPELKKRGRIRQQVEGATLREKLFPANGSARPPADHPAARYAFAQPVPA
ncbi:LLM class flavin-dependent oxidoreductase [Acetobacter sp. TBRC 12305]|uniref:LLM class flavin-dependent oxidoreductase n=1 Tax=Acetobacter garciniae TaxID=2817435 RepID=A0A939HR75_9PROT|nr:LLM class flavin-dependent oxidoreductase [Acetobacter garciniae]MBO1326662.1 LLM class flavin-dependent oxidoreductase [Acetobacter garciniae]MBX0345043.1 LLM class flavin-dependent oxidoreductase [Acetobacter garciniae]